jgi:hypothetical protein
MHQQVSTQYDSGSGCISRSVLSTTRGVAASAGQYSLRLEEWLHQQISTQYDTGSDCISRSVFEVSSTRVAAGPASGTAWTNPGYAHEQMHQQVSTQYDLGSGWPNFWNVLDQSRIRTRADASAGQYSVRLGERMAQLLGRSGPIKDTHTSRCISRSVFKLVRLVERLAQLLGRSGPVQDTHTSRCISRSVF